MTQNTSLPTDYALVLQQINEDVDEDFGNLSESLRLSPTRLHHILEALRHKGLIAITRSGYGVWIRLSRRGKKLMHDMWPNTPAHA